MGFWVFSALPAEQEEDKTQHMLSSTSFCLEHWTSLNLEIGMLWSKSRRHAALLWCSQQLEQWQPICSLCGRWMGLCRTMFARIWFAITKFQSSSGLMPAQLTHLTRGVCVQSQVGSADYLQRWFATFFLKCFETLRAFCHCVTGKKRPWEDHPFILDIMNTWPDPTAYCMHTLFNKTC